MPTTAIRILIVDDHPVVRAGLSSMLSTHKDLEVVGSAASAEDALLMIEQNRPDVLLLDLRMPGMSGIALLHALKKLPDSPRAVILTSYEMDEDIYRAIQAGAYGYLLKNTAQSEMIAAIQAVHTGKHHIPPHIAARLAERMARSTLTNREVEILEMLVKGFTNKQIGKALHISENTARNHINSIIEKLEVSGRTEAATTAIQQGIVHVS